MTIKSLLLGSAAALVAVSTSHAADAIVAPEPEAVEYVKVCDTYGAGYYYIPGTETCLSINGLVRAQFTSNTPHGDEDHTAAFSYRARVNFDARSETELGTLRSYARFEGNGGATSTNVEVKQAYIQLGGFTVGYADSFWGEGGYLDADGPTGNITTGILAYSFAQDGITATISAEFDADDMGTNQSWLRPDVVGRLDYAGTWGRVFGIVGYDNNVNSAAGKLGAEINLDAITEGAKFILTGAYDFASGSKTTRYTVGNDWDFIVAYKQPLGDTLAANLQYSTSDDWSDGVVGANLVWTPVTNFEVLGEVNYDLDDKDVSTLLRFTRSF